MEGALSENSSPTVGREVFLFGNETGNEALDRALRV